MKRRHIIAVGTLLILSIALLSHKAHGQGSNFGVLQPGAQTVATLPTAATANAGQIRVVNDSTAVSAEGQTCTGSSTNTALAFSTGSSWKCF